MNRHTTKAVIATVLATAFAGLSLTAIAQNTATPAEAPVPQMQHRGHGPMAMDPAQRAERLQQMQQRHAQRHAAHMEQLKAELKLTPAQETAWKAFVARTEATPRTPSVAAQDWSKLSTPQRLDAMEALHNERSAAMAKRIDATRSFYAQLSPEQQKTFDAQSHGFHRAGMKGEYRHGGKGQHGGQGHHGMGHGGGMGGSMGGAGPRS